MHTDLYNYENIYLTASLGENLLLFDKIFENDAIIRRRTVRLSCGTECALIFMDGMVNSDILSEAVIKPMLSAESESGDDICLFLEKRVLFANEVSRKTKISEILRSIFYGDTAIFADGSNVALAVNTKGWRTRGIQEPADERVLQGPREGFDEAIMLNMAMLRRKLPTPDLRVVTLNVGRKTDTTLFMCYLQSVAKPKTVELLQQRISQVDIDGVLDINYIAEQIRTDRHSIFKTTGSTERPDIVAARLLEGRIAVFADGSPTVMTAPYLFCENFQSDDDYYLNYKFAAIGRILRYICFFLSISVPAIFLSITAYHPYLLPTKLAVSIAAARGGVPFAQYTECFLLILIFEILRETGIRMQQSVGHALSIVGGLVVGQAAVEAKLISAPMLIVVSLSCICGLTVPRLKSAVFYLRIIMLFAAVMFGLYGYICAAVLMLVRVFSITSFGTEYTAPAGSPKFQNIKDKLLRAPWWVMLTRPTALTGNKIRQRRRDKN